MYFRMILTALWKLIFLLLGWKSGNENLAFQNSICCIFIFSKVEADFGCLMNCGKFKHGFICRIGLIFVRSLFGLKDFRSIDDLWVRSLNYNDGLLNCCIPRNSAAFTVFVENSSRVELLNDLSFGINSLLERYLVSQKVFRVNWIKLLR